MRSTDKRSIHTKGTTENREKYAVEAYRSASETLGPIFPGMRKFALTRGQFGMIDCILHIFDQLGSAHISVWNWGVGKYDISCLERLLIDDRILSASLLIDISAKRKDPEILEYWNARFGADSVKYIINHAKIARIWNDDLKVLLRGSFNLNYNPRFENLDISEGGPEFDLVAEVEAEIPREDGTSGAAAYAASRLGKAFDQAKHKQFGTMELFSCEQKLLDVKGLNTWKA